jgi:hypothetical protein
VILMGEKVGFAKEARKGAEAAVKSLRDVHP